MDMPLEELASWTLQDPSETIEDGETFCGFGGGSLDATSGVLTLTYEPADDADYDEQKYDKTTVRFVEVEKLLDALTPGGAASRDALRDLLTELLDAHEL